VTWLLDLFAVTRSKRGDESLQRSEGKGNEGGRGRRSAPVLSFATPLPHPPAHPVSDLKAPSAPLLSSLAGPSSNTLRTESITTARITNSDAASLGP
jgi:hypothetical protein